MYWTDPDPEIMRKLIQLKNRNKRDRLKQVSNWEVDEYYERHLKKFDDGRRLC